MPEQINLCLQLGVKDKKPANKYCMRYIGIIIVANRKTNCK